MTIGVGADHRGFARKTVIVAYLESAGNRVVDAGCFDDLPCDYPDYALTLGRAVSSGQFDLGILICGSGIGMSLAANKVAGVRAAPVFDTHQAEMCKRHNNVNVLCLSADLTGESESISIIDAWLKAKFEGGRHQRRLDRIQQIETETHEAAIVEVAR